MQRLCILLILALLVNASNYAYAAAYLPADTRQTLEDYANSHGVGLDTLKTELSASGEIDCKYKGGGKNATANLVLNRQVLVTNAHIIFDAAQKSGGVDAVRCNFNYFDSALKRKSTVQIARVFKMGCGHCSEHPQATEDWVVLMLKMPAQGTLPYRLPTHQELLDHSGRIHFYGNKAVDFCGRDKNGHCLLDKTAEQTKYRKYYIMPHFFEDCKIHDFFPGVADDRAFIQIGTDCSSSHGGSGGPILSWDLHNPIIYGIGARDFLTESEKHQEYMTGKPVFHEYHNNNGPEDPIKDWMNLGVAADGPFADAVRDAAKTVTTPNGTSVHEQGRCRGFLHAAPVGHLCT